MGKRSVIKLLITNSRGKNSPRIYAGVLRRCRMYVCVRVNKIFSRRELSRLARYHFVRLNRRDQIRYLTNNRVAVIENSVSQSLFQSSA